MKKILLSAAFPVVLCLHLGVKVFFPGLFAYGSQDQTTDVALRPTALRPVDVVAMAYEAPQPDPFTASIPGSVPLSASPTSTQP